jgi:hypothetical protein
MTDFSQSNHFYTGVLCQLVEINCTDPHSGQVWFRGSLFGLGLGHLEFIPSFIRSI